MPEDRSNIEIHLVGSADLGALKEAASTTLPNVDRATQKTTESLKKLEQQAERTARAVSNSLPRIDPRTTLASSYIPTQKSQEELRRLERDAGLRTERSMGAESREAELQAARRRAFLESARTNRVNSFHGIEPGGEEGGASVLDLLKNIKASTAAVFAGVAGAVGLASKAVKEYANNQSAAAAVDASLASRGLLVSEYREKWVELAQQLSTTTAIPVDTWLKTIARLTSSGAGPDNIQKMAEATRDLSTIMGGNLQHAAIAMGKAMGGNLDTLREWGIVVPNTVDKTKQLESALRQIKERGGGQAEAFAQSLSGQFDTLKNSTSNLLAGVGGLIVKVSGLGFLMQTASFGAQKFAEALGYVPPAATSMNNALKSSSAELDKVRASTAQAKSEFESIKGSIERATKAYERQKDAAKLLVDAQNEMADSQLQVQLANIENNPALNDRQKITAKAAARAQSDQRKFQREQGADAETVAAGQRYLGNLDNQLGLRYAEQGDLKGQITKQDAQFKARSDAANADIAVERARKKLADIRQGDAFADASEPGVAGRARAMLDTPEIEKAKKAIADAEEKAKAAHEKSAAIGSPSDEKLAQLNHALAENESAILDLTKELREKRSGTEDQIAAARLRMDVRGGTNGNPGTFANSQTVARLETSTALRHALNNEFPAADQPNRNRMAAVDQLVTGLAADPNLTPQAIRQLLASLGLSQNEQRLAGRNIPAQRVAAPPARLQPAYPIDLEGAGHPSISGGTGDAGTSDPNGMHPHIGGSQPAPNGAPHISGDLENSAPSSGLSVHMGNAAHQPAGQITITVPNDTEGVRALVDQLSMLNGRMNAALARGLSENVNKLKQQIEQINGQIRLINAGR